MLFDIFSSVRSKVFSWPISTPLILHKINTFDWHREALKRLITIGEWLITDEENDGSEGKHITSRRKTRELWEIISIVST
jgi:hypothetical protein